LQNRTVKNSDTSSQVTFYGIYGQSLVENFLQNVQPPIQWVAEFFTRGKATGT